MIVHLLSDNVNPSKPYLDLPPGFTPTETQLRSTPADNLIEFSGRVCYDSLGSPKSRSSEDYFKHIHEVKHTSIMEHVYRTFLFWHRSYEELVNILYTLTDRPGVKLCYNNSASGAVRVTLNARSAYELYDLYSPYMKSNSYVVNMLKIGFNNVCPLAVPAPSDFKYDHLPQIGIPGESEQYFSFYLAGVSRNLTHELIRHRHEAAVSQRSTRYVDEGESNIAWHPLFNDHDEYTVQNTLEDTVLAAMARNITAIGRSNYKETVHILEKYLESKGVDKFTARKQARGAARGMLPSALSTELVFTASLMEWRHIINSRSQNAADAEIRLMTNKVFDVLHSKGLFKNHTKEKAKDGIGYEITIR